MKTFLVEGDIAAADTFTALATRGSETTPSMQLPADWKKVTKIFVAVAIDFTAPGSAIYILRLSGAAIEGTQDIVVGADAGQDPQAGSDTAPDQAMTFELDDVDIDVSGGDVISVQGCMTDTDLGTARMVVGLVGE